MKYIFKTLSCLLVLLICSSCISYSVHDENGNNFYKDMNRAIEYSYPKEWSKESYEGEGHIYIRPDNCTAVPEPFILISLVYNNNVDTKAALDTYVSDLEKDFDNVKLIDSDSGVDKNGNNFMSFKYTYTDKEGVQMYSSDRFIFLGQLLTVLVSGKCGAEDADTYNKDFNVTLESLTYFS